MREAADLVTVKINGLYKSYRNVEVLKNIHLEMEKGLFGLLGPNGAGKTTLMNIMSTALPWNEGVVSIYDYDLLREGEEVRKILGYLPQHFYPPGQLTGREFLHYVGSLKGITEKKERNKQVEKVLELVNLQDKGNKRIKGYSGGMKRRLGIAQAFIGNPSLIILDEPTAGLDPSERIRFRNTVERLSKDATIILSTHIISDIESSCEKVGVLHNGEVRFQGSTDTLAKLAANVVWEIAVPAGDYDEAEEKYFVLSTRREGNEVIFRVLAKEKPDPSAIPVQPSIEDGYMAVMHGVVS